VHKYNVVQITLIRFSDYIKHCKEFLMTSFKLWVSLQVGHFLWCLTISTCVILNSVVDLSLQVLPGLRLKTIILTMLVLLHLWLCKNPVNLWQSCSNTKVKVIHAVGMRLSFCKVRGETTPALSVWLFWVCKA